MVYYHRKYINVCTNEHVRICDMAYPHMAPRTYNCNTIAGSIHGLSNIISNILCKILLNATAL